MCQDAPDMTAQNEVAKMQTDLSKDQMAMAKDQIRIGQERQAKLDPIYMQLLQDSIADSATARDRGATQWQQYTSIFQPLENKLAETAANYDTAGRRDAAAADARATVQQQFDAQQQQQQRGLSRAGVSLDSGRALALQQSAGFQAAKVAAGADKAARTQVEERGIQLTDNAARFGRNQTGTALQASGQGAGATQAASGIGATGSSVFNSALQPGMSLMGGAASGLSSAGSMYGNIAQQQASQGGLVSDLASLGGTAAKLYSSGMFSSKKLKTRHGPVNTKTALKEVEDAAGSPAARGLNSLKVENWRYRKGVADGGAHQGPYAEDVNKAFGDEVAPRGLMIDGAAMSMKTNQAVAELSRQVDELEARLKDLA